MGADVSELPPLPPGFKLDDQGVPPLPPGFTLDSEPERGLWQKTKDLVGGRAEFDFPSASNADLGLSFGRSFFPAAASMFGSDEDFAKALKTEIPEAKFAKDKFGNAYFTTPEGKSFYVNEPGLDVSDVTRGVGKALSFVPAGRAAGLAKGLLGRVGATGAASGATDIAMQKAAGRENVDLGQTALVAGTGGAVELAAPALGAIGRQLRALMTNGRQAEAQALAKQYGIDLSPEGLRRLERLSGSEATPQARAAEGEFGFQLTRGQRTGDPRQLATEERLRSTHGPLARLEGQNREVLEENVNRMASQFGGPGATGSQQGAARQAQASLIGAERGLAGQVDEAYGALRGQKAFVKSDATLSLPKRIKRELSDFDVDPTLTPATHRTLQRLAEGAESAQKTQAISVRAIEAERRKINNAIGSAANRTDKAAMVKLKNAFDDWLDESVDQALFSGSKDIIGQLKQARSLRAELGRKFQSQDDVGRVIQKLLDPNRSPEEVANYLLGAAAVSKPAAARLVRGYKEAAGDLDPLRELVFLRMVQTKGGDVLGRDAIVSNIKASVQGRGASLMSELFTTNEMTRIMRFATALEQMQSKGMMARSSGTTERLWRFGSDLLGKIPGIGHLFELQGAIQSRRALQVPFAPPQMTGVTAVADAAATQ